MKCGVPQGSILGPLLFLIYINDLPSVSKYFMPILFADDTNLFCTGPNLHDIVCQINQEIKIIYSWVKANKLSLNIDKTNFMLFTPKRFSRAMDALLIDGKRIMEVSETKFLGVIIDNKLNWKPHIRHVNRLYYYRPVFPACAGNAGNVSPPPRVSDSDIHPGTCVTHVTWCVSGSLTRGLLWSRWRGKRSRHSRRMPNTQFYASCKTPMAVRDKVAE